MVVDPSILAARVSVEQIAADRECPTCGYNLRGLQVGGRCPECGQPIGSGHASAGIVHNLTLAPVRYLRRMRLATATLAVAGGVMIGLGGAAAKWGGSGMAVAFAAATVAWWGALYAVMAPRPLDDRTVRDAVLDSGRYRRWTLWGQLLWPGLGVASVVAVRMPSSLAFVVAACVLVGALVAMVPVCAYLLCLTEWAGNAPLAGGLRTLAWGFLVLPILAALSIAGANAGGALGTLGWVVAWVVGPLNAVLLAMFWLCLAGVAFMCAWAVDNSYELQERDRRSAQRRADEERAALERAWVPPSSPLASGSATGVGEADADAGTIPLEPEQ